MKAVVFAIVTFLSGVICHAEAPGQLVTIVASLKEYYLVGVMLQGIDGSSEHYDSLALEVDSPEEFRGERIAVWVAIPTVIVDDPTAQERAGYWSSRIGLKVQIETDRRVFSDPQSYPCALICGRDHLKWIEKKAEPGATDNPDDAQRLREDY